MARRDVVRSDIFMRTRARLVVCVLTTGLLNAEVYGYDLAPSPASGLRGSSSQIMVDSLLALSRDRIREDRGRRRCTI